MALNSLTRLPATLLTGMFTSLRVSFQAVNGNIRSLFDKLTDSITIEDFGAVGDGVTDDTIAIQKALDSGCLYVTKSVGPKKYYRITDTLLMKKDEQTFDLRNSELVMDEPTLTKAWIIVQNTVQMNGPRIRRITFTGRGVSNSYNVRIRNVGAFVVEDCTSYGYTGNRANGFIDVECAIVGYIRRNRTESPVESSVSLRGLDNDAGRCVDVAVYDNRFVKGKNALKYGDYCEGLFIRRNIFYAQTGWQLEIAASTAAKGLLSGKIQQNDFDSPQTSAGGIYMQFFKNVQITGNWFANNSSDPMINLRQGTDGVLISDNQAYPKTTFIMDNGQSTIIASNMVFGGITQVYFGTGASGTSVVGNTLAGASAGIDTNDHVGTLYVANNTITSTGPNGGLVAKPVPPVGHTYIGNVGDKVVGSGSDVVLGASPATYVTGPRTELLGFKGGSISNISVNNQQMAVQSNVLMTVPPHSTVTITYSGATPGLGVLRLM